MQPPARQVVLATTQRLGFVPSLFKAAKWKALSEPYGALPLGSTCVDTRAPLGTFSCATGRHAAASVTLGNTWRVV